MLLKLVSFEEKKIASLFTQLNYCYIKSFIHPDFFCYDEIFNPKTLCFKKGCIFFQ
jgi:hypothetical protein